MIETNLAIIGAGFAGIAAGYAAQEKNIDAVIFESDKTWGGLCGNFTVEGFRFDKAVHLSFNEPDLVKKIFLSLPHYEHSSESNNFADGYWVRHPICANCPLKKESALFTVSLTGKIFPPKKSKIISVGLKFSTANILLKNILRDTRGNIGRLNLKI